MSYLLGNLIGTTIEMVAIGSWIYICDIEQKFWLYRLALWFYRKAYNLTHEHPLPPGKIHLVYRAGIRSWVHVATAVMLLEPLFGIIGWRVFGQHIEFKVEFITAIPHLFGVIVGFYIGPLVNYLFQRREKVLDALEKFDEKSVGEHVKHLTKEITEQITDAAAEGIRHVILPKKTEPEKLPPARTPEEKPFDPDEIIRNFGNRRNDS